jgi:glycosyltransferase involved in cell wall biosynthesis/peptidoglycan/xylan/chitin deacetylase (PgdA/CDA1 family)
LVASIVIPTFNRADSLRRSLDALSAQTTSERFEVIVVDDGSTDGTSAMIHAVRAPYAVTYIATLRQGAGAARNTGLARATGRLICFLDDDVIAEPTWLDAFLDAHARFPGDALIGRIDVVDQTRGGGLAQVIASLRERQASMQRELTPHDLVTGNCAISRATLMAIGGFDATLPSAEDFELAVRLEDGGTPLRYCPDARATEYVSRGADLFVDGAFRNGIAHARIARRHPRVARRLGLGRPYQARLPKRIGLKLLWFAASVLPAPTRPAGPWHVRGPSWLWRYVGSLFYWSGVRREFRSLAALRAIAQPEVVILGYHVVDDAGAAAAEEYRLDADRFGAQVAHLVTEGFMTITIQEWMEALAGRVSLPARPIVLTFDDGDRRTLARVGPVLAAVGYRGVAFLVSNALGSTNRWDEALGYPRREILTADDVRALVAAGWEIGSHGRTHRSLPGSPESTLRDEVVGSRADLQAIVGRPVTAFAYPYGNYDRGVVRTLQAAEYASACCSEAGVNDPTTNPLTLRRIFIAPDDDLRAFGAKLRRARALGRSATVRRWYERLRRRMP